MPALGDLFSPVLSLVYPPRCFVCRTLGSESCLCARCADAITGVPDPKCDRCGHPCGGEGPCSNCRFRPPAFVRGRALGGYEGVLRDAIHRFKFHDRPGLAEPLGQRLAAFARAASPSLHGLQFDALVPVPMHPVRKRSRGYNQSERLAQVLARELGLPLPANLLVRSRSTQPQVGLSGQSRQTNLHGAFVVPRPTEVSDKTLLLIDDVTTTGATLNECAAALRASGARAVYALTLAAD